MDSGELQDHLSSSGSVKFLISHASINMLVQKQVMAIWNWSSGELCGPWDSCFAFLRLSRSIWQISCKASFMPNKLQSYLQPSTSSPQKGIVVQ